MTSLQIINIRCTNGSLDKIFTKINNLFDLFNPHCMIEVPHCLILNATLTVLHCVLATGTCCISDPAVHGHLILDLKSSSIRTMGRDSNAGIGF